jgi:hypothetical protein
MRSGGSCDVAIGCSFERTCVAAALQSGLDGDDSGLAQAYFVGRQGDIAMTAAEYKPSRAGAFFRNVSLYLVAVTFILTWLPFVRSMLDGDAYEWGTAYFTMQFSGKGLSGDFWLLAAQVALAFAILYLGFRRPGHLSNLLLTGWLALNAASYGYGLLRSPDALILQGDTLDVRINIGAIAFAIYGGALLLALLAARLEFAIGRRPPHFAWTRANSVALLLALALLPVQFALLRFGVQHERNDEIGVILTMAQWAAIVFALGLARKHPV